MQIHFKMAPMHVTLFPFFHFYVANTSHSLVLLENKRDDDSFWDNVI